MNIQTFVSPEMEDVTFDDEKLQQWREKVENLALAGQLAITQKMRPIPFLAMNNRLQLALKTLCPRQSEMKQYSHEAIPNEVLAILEMAVADKHFHKIEIWYDDKDLDLVAVGINGTWRTQGVSEEFATEEEAKAAKPGSWTYYSATAHYLLARLGAEAKALSQLVLDAKTRWTVEATARLTRQLRQTQREIEDIELTAVEQFG